MKLLRANVVVPASSTIVAQVLPLLLGRFIRARADGAFSLDVSRHAIAELDADPMNSMPAVAEQERWYPLFHGTMKLVPLPGGRTDITIAGAIEHSNGPIHDTHYEWSATEKALLRLTELLRRHFVHVQKVAVH